MAEFFTPNHHNAEYDSRYEQEFKRLYQLIDSRKNDIFHEILTNTSHSTLIADGYTLYYDFHNMADTITIVHSKPHEISDILTIWGKFEENTTPQMLFSELLLTLSRY